MLFSFQLLAIIPLTGEGRLPKGLDFGDPSPPYFYPNRVEVYTTGGYVLQWKSIDQLLQGKPATVSFIKLFHNDRTPFSFELGEDIWDPTIENGLLYGGVMVPPPGHRNANEDDHSWTRRVFAFKNIQGKWVREKYPLSGPLPAKPTWLGHTYGHHFITADNGERYMFYEKVTEDRNNTPWKTEIFARKMRDLFNLTGPEIPILKLNRIWDQARRSFGGSLVEGPRPFKANGIYFISFSAGDYQSDDYGIHILASKNLLGPYKPYLTPDKRDLKNFSDSIEKQVPMTWGAARASFFEVNGKFYSLFHGIKDTGSEINGLRNVWLGELEISNCKDVYCTLNIR